MSKDKLLSTIISILKNLFNFTFWALGYLLVLVNVLFIFISKKEKNEIDIVYEINNKNYSATGKLKKLLKYMNYYKKKSFEINEKDLEFSCFGAFAKINNDTNDELLIVFPNLKNTINSIFSNYKIIRDLVQKENVKIAINSQTKYMFWVIIFSPYLIKIKTSQFANYKAVIYLNSPFDHVLDVDNIPNLALLSKRFYCFFSKYISDNFPWINICCDSNDILSKSKFSICINSYGYDEFLNVKFIDSKVNTCSPLFANSFLKNFGLLENIKFNSDENSSNLGIIFPIYNNGLYLKCRSFKSCLFNESFNNCKFFLIDDGSKHENDKYINYIENKFSNVFIHKFNDGGSGSPSRPRNTGINLALKYECDYICFLDPDNHFLPLSIDRMLSDINSGEHHICAYNMWTFGRNYVRPDLEAVIKYNAINEKFQSNNYVEILKHFKYKCFNMQQIIMKTSWFSQNLVYEYEDLIGEDVIFWYELMLKNPSIIFYNAPNSIYFNFQKGSLTNSVNPSFFTKAITGYKHLFSVLLKNNLIDQYIKCEFYNNFYEGLLMHWNDQFDKKFIKELKDVFNMFDEKNNEADKINLYRNKCVEVLKI